MLYRYLGSEKSFCIEENLVISMNEVQMLFFPEKAKNQEWGRDKDVWP